jgi:hypothetical protein
VNSFLISMHAVEHYPLVEGLTVCTCMPWDERERKREFWSEEIMLKSNWKAWELTVVCVLGEHRCVQNRCRHD